MKTLTDSATLPGLAAGVGLVAKKFIKEPMTSHPSSNLMNYVKFTVVIAASIAAKRYPKNQKIFFILKMFCLYRTNVVKLAAVCAIIETTLIFYLRDIATELRQKFHDKYLSLIFNDNGEDLEDSSPEVAGHGAASDKVADK